MDLQKDLEELLAIEDQDQQFLSVYLDTSVNQEGQRNYPVFLKKKASVLSKLQEHRRGEAAAREFQLNIRQIERYLFDHLEKDTQGVALFSNVGKDYFKALQLPVPVRNKFALSTSPNLDVLIELAEENRQYCVVTIDQHSGKIFNVYFSNILTTREMYDDGVPGRTKVGGWSQMRYQRHRLDHIQHFMRDFAEQLERYVRREKPSSIVLLGTPANIAEFRRQLNLETERRILLTRSIPPHTDDRDLVAKSEEYIREAENAAGTKSAEQLYDRLCQDYLVVVGMDETLFNLQVGKLERLFISDLLDGQGFRCTHCDFIFSASLDECLYCQSPVEPVDLRNRMQKLAGHHDVQVEVIASPSFLDSLGNCGGFLRF